MLDKLLNGPWGSPPPNGGRKPQNGGENVEDMMRAAEERLRRGFGGGPRGPRGPRLGGDMPAGKAIGFGLLLLVALWLASGLYRVQPEENAVILTFGKWTDTRAESGLGYALPAPIQEVQKVNVAFDRRLEVGFRDAAGGRAASSGMNAESMMLTGDENIIDINFVVLWRISDAGKFLFNIRDQELTLRNVAESAMREIIGQSKIQRALTEGRDEIESDTKALMQKILDEYQSGIVVNSVQLLRVNPPAPVVDAFDDVQRARTDLERMKNEAETYRNDIVPKARGEAQKMIQDAEAYKTAVISKAEGEAARFLSVYEAYAKSKDVTQKRLYIETLEQVLKGARKVILGDAKAGAVLPYLPLSDLTRPAAGRQPPQPQ
jgi:membrane protease subunit HflK